VAAPRKYDQEFRDRAVRMYRDRLAEPGESKLSARPHVGSLLDLNQATLRNWVEERCLGSGRFAEQSVGGPVGAGASEGGEVVGEPIGKPRQP